MFNMTLFFIILAFSLPGILIAIPGTLRFLLGNIQEQFPAEKELPSYRKMLFGGILQTLILVAIFNAIGIFLSPMVDLGAPFFEALAVQEGVWKALQPQIAPSLLFGTGGALLFIGVYYFYYRPRFDHQTLLALEGLRMHLGVFARIFYGGIVEEVIIRWGLLTLLLWLAKLIFRIINPLIFWSVVLVSGVLFGLGHMPAYINAGCKKTPIFISAMVILNLWGSMIFSWLFLQYGLAAAMLGHMIFHLVWYPFDLYHYRRLETD